MHATYRLQRRRRSRIICRFLSLQPSYSWSADELALRVASATKGCRGMLRCKYAVRAAHLALAEVKTLASTGKRGASFLPTAVLLRVVESSRHLLFLVRSAAERNRKFYAPVTATHGHLRGTP